CSASTAVAAGRVEGIACCVVPRPEGRVAGPAPIATDNNPANTRIVSHRAANRVVQIMSPYYPKKTISRYLCRLTTHQHFCFAILSSSEQIPYNRGHGHH